MRVLIFGAGSIGNHMAFACHKLKLEIFVTDVNPKALNRMQNIIFPRRYGFWSKKINLINFKNLKKYKNFFFDLIIIGTPPKFHLSIFFFINNKLKFDKVLIEKPLTNIFNKSLEKIKKFNNKKIFIGYNHSISKSFSFFLKNIKKTLKSHKLKVVNINWNESWHGIMNAHFWLKSIKKSYLSKFKDGGGALQEHSHGLHLAFILNKLTRSNFFKSMKSNVIFEKKKIENYDYETTVISKNKNILFKYNTNLYSGSTNKSIELIFDKFNLIWICNFKKNFDLVRISKNNNLYKEKFFKKTRSSEFENELKHIIKIKSFKNFIKSPIQLFNGIKVQEILNKIAYNGKKYI